ncbi:MotA/TolQ/ExbB proton channel family protein [Simplicispira suum]|uniref:Biopolymer transporter ExbD n=1 Tax=Simplicispira suum TaxID=2109915 RepID=A0A2S0N4Q9_9BURK|nr:MotA/TolQ/ExbB proton channel family protein [Simplicispira suum]AVO42923.1 biopolymer transporter ExbD [Simplicispira suum]MCB1975304.1 MotA/TolQ/ExbB proton channel family protein [Burkholderiaceae bacterium]
MSNPIESMMYGVSQFFLFPVLLAIAALFVHAFYAAGAFAWQAWQRRSGKVAGFEMLAARRANPAITVLDLEVLAAERLEFARIATRVAPMLGLVATMIPMGPALMALADGNLADVSRSLMVAFSAVILALLAAAISYSVVNVRKRWYATDLAAIEQGTAPAETPAQDMLGHLVSEVPA